MRLNIIYDEEFGELAAGSVGPEHHDAEIIQSFDVLRYYTTKPLPGQNVPNSTGGEHSKRLLAVEKEIRLYEELPSENITAQGLLQWWLVHSTRIPMIAKFARFIFAIPASSAGVESQFSTAGAGGIVRNRRNAIGKSTVENILMRY